MNIKEGMGTRQDNITLRLGGREYVIPKLIRYRRVRIGQLILKAGTLPMNGNAITVEQADIVYEIIWVGLQQEHPDLTKDKVKEIYEFDTGDRLIETVLTQAGFGNTAKFNLKKRRF